MNDLQSSQSPHPSANTRSSTYLFRSVGYGLLILTFFNFVDIVVPLRLMNPVWELQTIGAIVESVPIPLLSLALIFYQEASLRRNWELLILKALSWLALLFGILLLLLIPLAASNTVRINIQATTQMSADYRQQIAQVDQLQAQVNEATTESLTSFLTSQGISLDGQNPQEVKDQLLTRFTETKQQIQAQYETEQANRRASLLKNAVKWSSGALVSGFLFIYAWKLTHWARRDMKWKS